MLAKRSSDRGNGAAQNGVATGGNADHARTANAKKIGDHRNATVITGTGMDTDMDTRKKPGHPQVISHAPLEPTR
jgi:hypothetical protein